MYTPAHFREERSEVLLDFNRAHPLATLVTSTESGLDANHIPVLVVDENTLRGHVARGNPIWKESQPEALAIFTAHDYYVSPSLYPSKQEQGGRVVPTWNYSAVHVHGRLSFFDDRDRLRDIVDQLTGVHEAGSEHPWAITDAPPDFIDGLLGAIVGFDLKISRMVGKFKQSQNRSAEDREAVRRRHPLP
jgi:transcriptional regulator